MVEEMYQQELNEAEVEAEDREMNQSNSNNSGQQTQTPPTSTATATEPPPPQKRSDINAENDPSLVAINRQQDFSENQAMQSTTTINTTVSEVVPPFDSDLPPHRSMAMDDTCRYGSLVAEDYETGSDIGSSTLIRFGSTTGDVSLTLGLRHAGNVPDKNNFLY